MLLFFLLSLLPIIINEERTMLTRSLLNLLVAFCICFPTWEVMAQNAVQQVNNNRPEYKTIATVETVQVQSPVGTVPRLPYQLWVTYSDGTAAYRQVMWTNSALSTEEKQSDSALYPVGTRYTIKGFVIGDNTTAEGFPIEAIIDVVADAYETPSNKPVAEPLPLDKVVIEGNNRLTSNRDLAIKTILSWDVSQQLYNYRDTYGLSTEGYKKSDGWDSPTTKLKGHGSGHYMSALAFAFASASNKEQKDALRQNIRRMVDELRICQERTFVWNEELGRYWEARDFAPESELREMKGTWAAFDEHKKEWSKYGYGYLNAIPAHHAALIEMYRGYNNEQWVWAPYYAIHKQLAGLIDIANYVDDKEIAAKALLIAKDMGLWIWNRMHYRTFVDTEGTREERRKKPGNRYEMWNMYIAGEDGGTGESLSRLSEMVNDPTEKARLLEAASYFDSPAFFEPLSRNIDDIRTRHANQHIPKITSALRSYRGNANPYYYNLAQNFWSMIQGRYAYATGGVGNGEMFRQPYTQILSMNTNVYSDRNRNIRPNPTLNETCCAYNLAKLTKDLNCFNPDDARYMDYYERVLYNQIVGSLHPTHYMTTYHYAVGLDASKPWGNHTPQESCCGGTGSENHVKYQEAAYFVSDNTLWIGLYIPTTATWDDKKIKIKQECRWPAEKSTIHIVEGKAKFSMKLRVPYWAIEDFEVKLNGKPLAIQYKPCSYVEIPQRKWKKGDVVEIIMPFTKHINYGPDKMEIAATGLNETATPFAPMWVGTLMYGPLAMGTTGIEHWKQATLKVDSYLDDIHMNGATDEDGTNGNIYTLTVGDKLFKPDYVLNEHSTHYLRIHQLTDPATEKAMAESFKKRAYQALNEALQVTIERKKAQEAWLALDIKVPDYAPWAPYAYERLMQKYEEAQNVYENKNLEADEVSAMAASLNAAINTMRPGNLPELEDLSELLALLKVAKQKQEKSEALKEAIRYAEMVVSYVGDGSGTMDMIEKACLQLKK